MGADDSLPVPTRRRRDGAAGGGPTAGAPVDAEDDAKHSNAMNPGGRRIHSTWPWPWL